MAAHRRRRRCTASFNGCPGDEARGAWAVEGRWQAARGPPAFVFFSFSCLVAVAGTTLGVHPRLPPPLRLGCWWAGGGACVPCVCVAWTDNIVIVLIGLSDRDERRATHPVVASKTDNKQRWHCQRCQTWQCKGSRWGLTCARLPAQTRRWGSASGYVQMRAGRAVLWEPTYTVHVGDKQHDGSAARHKASDAPGTQQHEPRKRAARAVNRPTTTMLPSL